jgi:hypothetical protein
MARRGWRFRLIDWEGKGVIWRERERERERVCVCVSALPYHAKKAKPTKKNVCA